MTETAPAPESTNKAQELLDDFDNKRSELEAKAQAQYNSEVGVTDFSEEAREQLGHLAKAPEAFDAALAENETFEVNKTISGDKHLKYAQKLAKEVAELLARKSQAGIDEAEKSELGDEIEVKEEHIETIVSTFLDSEAAGSLSAEVKDALLSSIYDTTETAPDDEATTTVVPPSGADTLDADAADPDVDPATTGTTPDTLDADAADPDVDPATTGTTPDTLDADAADPDADDEPRTPLTKWEKLKAFVVYRPLEVLKRRTKAVGDFLKSKVGQDAEHGKRNRNIALGAVAASAMAVGYMIWRSGGVAPSGSGAGDHVGNGLPGHNGTDVLPTTPGTGGGASNPGVYNFSDSAHTVTPGEGWFQTMKDLNIPAGDRSAVMAAAGPKLEQMGAAYRDTSIGGFGINMPANGQLSNEVLKVIADAAK